MTTRTRQRTTTRQAGQTANQVHPDYASVENTDGVTFSSGNMIVRGNLQTPVEAVHWESSNGTTNYTTVKWRDPDTGEERVSCNCPGWAMKRKDQLRKCKHTNDMMGIKPCNATRVNTVAINNVVDAEREIPKYDGKELRGIMLDWD